MKNQKFNSDTEWVRNLQEFGTITRDEVMQLEITSPYGGNVYNVYHNDEPIFECLDFHNVVEGLAMLLYCGYQFETDESAAGKKIRKELQALEDSGYYADLDEEYEIDFGGNVTMTLAAGNDEMAESYEKAYGSNWRDLFNGL